MAYTDEQQAALDIQMAVEDARHTYSLEMHAKASKLEAVRMAKEVMVENSRSLPADERAVGAESITAYAATLLAYING
jgi:hypothetical protein